MARDDLEQLAKASEGLLYPSETDAPFDVFCWAGQDNARTAQAQMELHAPHDKQISEMLVNDFFAELDESEDAARFRQLREVLQKQLTGLRVFRVGSTRIDVYVIGKTHSGDWAGLHTVSVET